MTSESKKSKPRKHKPKPPDEPNPQGIPDVEAPWWRDPSKDPAFHPSLEKLRQDEAFVHRIPIAPVLGFNEENIKGLTVPIEVSNTVKKEKLEAHFKEPTNRRKILRLKSSSLAERRLLALETQRKLQPYFDTEKPDDVVMRYLRAKKREAEAQRN